MKTLQNNFTTPEQSKRLLELGVPADSANMHYHQECVRMEHGKEEFEYFLRYGKPDTNKYSTDIPCWSVGRLIEIFSKCYTGAKCYYSPRNLYKTEFWIERFDRLSKICFIDFSKLED